jgi:hypothetical protein
MANAFQQIMQLILDGDDVAANTVNNRLSTLLNNDRFLKSLIEEATLGSAIYARGVTVPETVLVGTPVYLNPNTQVFEGAIALTEIVDGSLVTAASSQVWGVVAEKYNSTKADILITGYRELDITPALASGETLGAGTYFLSGAEAGKLTKTEPPTGIAVLQADGLGKVLVRTSFADIFAGHRHHRHSLACVPAGDEDINTGIVTIINTDPDVEGWLPANHAVFDGKAPSGAFFGYNLSASSLKNVWPPLPIQSVYLEWFRGDVAEPGATGVPLGEDGLCLINTDGIWWMSECAADAPWTDGTPPGGPCPLPLAKYMTLWFSRMVFQTRGSVVTSLRSGSPQLQIRCLNGVDPAVTGDLEITLDLALLLSPVADNYGGTALKGLVGNTFTRGPVLSSVKSLSSSIVLSSNLPPDGDGRYFGNVDVTYVGDAAALEIPISLVDLYGAQEENFQGTLAIGLPPDRDSKFRGEFVIPSSIAATTVEVAFRTWILGRTAGDLPDLTFNYRVLPRPNPLSTPQSLVTSDTSGTLSTGNVTVLANQYIEIASNVISAPPGSIVLFEVVRSAAAGDGYAGELHFMRKRAAITGVTV